MLGRKYKGKEKPYKDEDTLRYLAWLAGKLIEQDETEFLIERLQPDWLPFCSQKIYRLLFGLLDGLLLGLLGGLIFGLIVGFSGGLMLEILVGGLSIGLIGGLFSELYKSRIRTVETLQFSPANNKFGVLGGLLSGLLFGLNAGLIYGLLFGLLSGLIFGLQGPEIEIKTFPNQGIWQSIKNVITLAVLSSPLCFLLWALPSLAAGQPFRLSESLIFGLGGGLTFSIGTNGRSAMQNFCLRLLLWGNGSIPWNYARFLDYATDRLFLQRVGGGYRFIHDLLRRHIAAVWGTGNRERGMGKRVKDEG